MNNAVIGKHCWLGEMIFSILEVSSDFYDYGKQSGKQACNSGVVVVASVMLP